MPDAHLAFQFGHVDDRLHQILVLLDLIYEVRSINFHELAGRRQTFDARGVGTALDDVLPAEHVANAADHDPNGARLVEGLVRLPDALPEFVPPLVLHQQRVPVTRT